jgi:SAM-dependent methyltransferase/spore maturation protein CgeB
MHDDHEAHGGGQESNPWPDRVNEAYYDKMGADFGRQTRDRINWMCAQAKGKTVLDVGCSQGIASLLMAREGFAVVGVDIFRPAVDYASAERNKEIETVRDRLEFRCTDLAAIEGGPFDTVVMGEVIEHQTNPVRFIQRAAALVGPEGRIVITVPYGLHPWPDHKSTVFPRHIASALGSEFELTLLEVIDGYIRVVADRRAKESVGDGDHVVLLQATEKGALESQSRYYAANANRQQVEKAKQDLEERFASSQAERLKLLDRLRGLEGELALHAQSVVAMEAALLDARQRSQTEERLSRDHATAREKHVERVEKLLQEVAVHKALSEQSSRTIVELEGARQKALRSLDELEAKCIAQEERIEADRRLIAELEEAQKASGFLIQEMRSACEGHAAADSEYRRSISQLNEKLRATNAECARAEELQRSEQSLRRQFDELQHELVTAQHKRTAHWAKLEAERERSEKLVALAEELHRENELYRHSVALAIGRAFLGLKSPRGVLGFPRAISTAIAEYRQRQAGELASKPLAVPQLRHVHVPPMKSAGTGGGRAEANAQYQRDALLEAEKKKLSIIGWNQEADAAAVPVLSVLDEFSRSCFAPHAHLIEPRPDNWEGLLEAFPPRFLLVESCWKGNHGTWQYRVANYEHPPGKELAAMVEGCEQRGIPTVFWNKEDPTHFEGFIDCARRFDVVLTTAAEAIPKYEQRTSARVDVLQFAAEDSLHNPIGSALRNDKVCFAGSFYTDGFDARRDAQAMLLDAASEFELDVFDRNHGTLGSDAASFACPPEFAGFVRGKLSYRDTIRAYREYRVFLNVNSVSDSPTMFSRRVFELLACGTPVVSVWSRGTEETFGSDIVWHVRNRDEAQEAISVLLTDDREWRRRSLAGIRAVLSRHTYRHRFQSILRMVSQDAPIVDPLGNVMVVAEVASQAEMDSVLASFNRQSLDDGTAAKLLLVARAEGLQPCNASGTVELVSNADRPLADILMQATERNRGLLLAPVSPQAVYGRHYVQDLVHATRYSKAAIVGKPADGQRSSQYCFGQELDPQACIISQPGLAAAGLTLSEALSGLPQGVTVTTYAADTANFARTSSVPDAAQRHEILRQMEF